MSWSHQANSESGGHASVTIHNVPDECPKCHNKGSFSPLNLFYNSKGHGDRRLECIYRCPNFQCHEIFIGYYEQQPNGHYGLTRTDPKTHAGRSFSSIITKISSSFPVIYNQAMRAEDTNLDQICGPGYRKALEYIIKDYLLQSAKDEPTKESIKNEALGTVISNRIQDTNIKEVAKRAAWLGNDETHYIRKWAQKDLQDLKLLIDLTVHWMEAEALTGQLLKDMPAGQPDLTAA